MLCVPDPSLLVKLFARGVQKGGVYRLSLYSYRLWLPDCFPSKAGSPRSLRLNMADNNGESELHLKGSREAPTCSEEVCLYGSVVSMPHILGKSLPHRGPRALQPCPGSSPLAEAISAQILCLLDQVLWRLWALAARISAPRVQGSGGCGRGQVLGFPEIAFGARVSSRSCGACLFLLV